MPDLPSQESQTTPAPAPAEDPFDLGDTGLSLPLTQPDQPRNADGTFASPEPPPAPPLPVAAPASAHPDWLVSQAQELGFVPDEIAGTSTAALGKLVHRAFRDQIAFRDQLSRERAVQPQPFQPQAPAAPQPAAFDYGVPQDQLAEVHPSVLAAIRNVGEQSSRRIAELEKQLAQERQTFAEDRQGRQQQEQRSLADIVDAAFMRLGDKYAKVLGAGPASKFTAAERHLLGRRVAILTEAGITPQNLNRATIVAELRKAADALFGPALVETPAPVVPVPAVTAEQWANGSLAAPTHRDGAAEPKGDALAIANLAKRMRDRGAVQTDQDVWDGIPD